MSNVGNSTNSTWKNHFSRWNIGLNDSSLEWKDTAKEVLSNSEVISSKELVKLKADEDSQQCDPRILMDVRHSQVNNDVKQRRHSFPRESIINEARKLIRKERLERIAQERELLVVNNEIETLKGRIRKQRERYKIGIEKYTPDKFKEQELLKKRLESQETCTRIDSWLRDSFNLTRNPSKNRQAKENHEMTLKVILTPKIKSSITVEEINEKNTDTVQCTVSHEYIEKKELPQEQVQTNLPIINYAQHNRILEVKFKLLKQNLEHKLKLKTWQMWRKFIQLKKMQRDNSLKETKIEMFLNRLQELKHSQNKPKPIIPNKSQLRVASARPLLQRAKTATNLSYRPIDSAVLTEKRNKLNQKDAAEMKLETIEHEIESSSTNAHNKLNKSLKEFDPRLKGKVRLLRTVSNIGKDKIDKVEVEMRKILPPPAVLQRMEKRNKERHERWEAIKQRKRKIDEEKERQRLEIEEKIKAEELNEKKKKVEEIREKRRLEKEAEEERKREMEYLKDMMKKAKAKYNKNLLKLGWQHWRKLIKIRKKKEEIAIIHYRDTLTRNTFIAWRELTIYEIYVRDVKVKTFFNNILKKKYFKEWIDVCKHRTIQYQAAADWGDIKLLEKTIQTWVNYVQDQQIIYLEKMKVAQNFYNKLLLRKHFYKWQRLPDVRRYEREREDRKRVWRNKVQEFLPDYRPMTMLDNNL